MSRTLGDFQKLWAVQADLGEKSAKTGGKSATKAERPPNSRLRVGDIVWCTDLDGLFRRCRCGHARFLVYPGVGPHAAQLRCTACDVGGRWLRRSQVEAGQ